MRTLVVVWTLALLVTASAPRAWGQAAAPGAVTAPVQRTTVSGTAPPLEGRWLLLATIGPAGGGGRKLAALWDVARGAGGPEIVERFARLPDPQEALLARARWEPNQEDLRAIAQAWDELPPDARGVSRVEHDVFGQDGFTADVKGDPTAEGARWVVRQTYTFAPGRARPSRQVTLLAATSVENGIHRGRYLSIMFASAPAPIPIRIEGTFELIPLPARSWWARLLDVFRGCNRAVP